MAAISISKRIIGPKKTELIKNVPNVAVAVWVEKGTIEVVHALDGAVVAKIGSAGSVPLDGAAVHLRNPGKTAATVFVAMSPLGSPASMPALESFSLAAPAAVGVKWNLICDIHGLVNPDPLSRSAVEALQTSHEDDDANCRDRTEIIKA